MDDDAELRLLRERVYGVEGGSASPEAIARLAELEESGRRAGSDDATPTGTPVPPSAEVADETPDAEAPDAISSAPRVLPRWVLATAGAVALVGIGIAIGASLALPAASADPAAAELPELTFPQTVEDVISADILRDSGVDPASTRYIATVGDFRIYLARPDDGDGRCIATFTSTDNRPWSAGCASGEQVGAAVFGVDDDLTVAIGEPAEPAVTGIPIRLSESVTAYVAR